jgi:hypothetical protein
MLFAKQIHRNKIGIIESRYHRSSIRLKGYDYSQAGLYFVTICCQDMICRFGKIADGKTANFLPKLKIKSAFRKI